MKLLRVRLEKDDGLAEILNVLQQGEAAQVCFVLPARVPAIRDEAVVRKMKTVAKKFKKEIHFVTKETFLTRLLSAQKISTYKTCPDSFADAPEKTVSEVLAPPSSTEEKDTEESLEHPEGFASHEIHKTPFWVRWRGVFFFVLLLLLGVGAGVWWWIQPRAVIDVKPRISAEPVIQNVLIVFPEATVPEEESELPQVPGIFVETSVTATETFPSSGREYDLTSAQGPVTLFNETQYPKRLVPSRLSDADGVIFRFAEEVEIPPRTEEGPGELVVSVVADDFDENEVPIGERGNITAGTNLFFPALRDELRELYYARANKGAFTGGSTVTHYFLEEKDKTFAHTFLLETFRTRAIDQLKKEIQSRSRREKKHYILLDDPHLLKSALSEFHFPEELIGTETQTVSVSGMLELYGIVFDQEVVAEILLERLKQTLDDRQRLVEIDDRLVEYQVLDSEQLAEEGWLKLSVKMIGVKTLDLQSPHPEERRWRRALKEKLAGLSLVDARSVLVNVPEIETVRFIRLTPWWREELPVDLDRIHLQALGRGEQREKNKKQRATFYFLCGMTDGKREDRKRSDPPFPAENEQNGHGDHQHCH
ncbi:MAG: hypothetical protein K9M51_03635 [Candidatus Gracilibacteria bacterium]|nr:hypothetical protein [Candidatus Gracilibacteria bacterium]